MSRRTSSVEPTDLSLPPQPPLPEQLEGNLQELGGFDSNKQFPTNQPEQQLQDYSGVAPPVGPAPTPFNPGCRMHKGFKILIAVLIFIAVLLTVILVPISLKRVDHDQLGIRYDKTLKKVYRDGVLREGVHNVGPAGTILKFQRTTLEVANTGSDSIYCLAHDGVQVQCEVTVQYQIDPNRLFELFDTFGDQETFEAFVKVTSRDLLRNTCANFTARQFYSDRESVKAAMAESVEIGFVDRKVPAFRRLVQLVNVELPDAITVAILATQDAEQDIQKAQNEKGERLVQAQTEVLKAEADLEIAYIKATASAQALREQNTEQISRLSQQWEERIATFETWAKALNVTGEEFVDSFLKTFAIQERGSGALWGVPAPSA